MFLGKTKGYHLYDPKCPRVLYSQDVLFNESSCGFEKESSEQEERRYVTINHTDDEESIADKTVEPVL